MRICLVIHALVAGGAERVAANLANEWVRAGHEPRVVTIAAAGRDFYPLDERIDRRGLDLVSDSDGLARGIAANVQRVRRLRHELRAARPDVIVSFIDRTNVLTLLAAAGLGIPVVVSERIDPRMLPLGTAWEALRRLTYPHASALVVQTESVARWACGLTDRGRIAVLENPVSESCLEIGHRGAGDREKRVVGIGRLVAQKGFDTLIQAFDRASAAHPEWSLTIAGQGPLDRELRQQADRTRAAGRIVFAGLVSRPEELLGGSEIFALSSRFEGFPNALVEGMACGCCVVATDCPSGPADIVSNGVDGVLVPVDDVDALADSLAALMADEPRRRRLASAAAASARRFRVERIAAAWIDLLQTVSAGASAPAGEPRFASER